MIEYEVCSLGNFTSITNSLFVSLTLSLPLYLNRMVPIIFIRDCKSQSNRLQSLKKTSLKIRKGGGIMEFPKKMIFDSESGFNP